MNSTQSIGKNKFTPTIQTVWLLLPLAVSFIALNLTPLKEGDLWWYLKVGEQILRTRQLSLLDTFSFTALGGGFSFAYSWLGAVILYLVEKAGGLSAIVLVQSLVSTFIVGILLREGIKRGTNLRISVLVILISWIGLYAYSSTRPQIFSFLFFAVFFMLCSDYTRGKKNRLRLLPVLMLLWVNLHGAWSMGVIVWFVFFVGNVLHRWWAPDQGAPVSPLLGWGLAMILVLPLNPDGFKIITNISSASGYLINAQYVSEWQPLVITNRLSWPFFGLLALWVLGLAFTGEKTSLQELALMFIFTYLSLRYLRMPPYFYIIAAPIVAEKLSRVEWNQIIGKFERILNLGSTHKPASKNPINGVILIIFFLVALISLPPVRLALTQLPSTALISRNFPVDAVDTLKVMPSRIYSLSEWGGYLIWKFTPQASVFVDGRIALYPLPVWDDYLKISLAAPGWQELLDRYAVDTLVLSKERQGAIITAARQAGWRDISEDRASVILMRPSALTSGRP